MLFNHVIFARNEHPITSEIKLSSRGELSFISSVESAGLR